MSRPLYDCAMGIDGKGRHICRCRHIVVTNKDLPVQMGNSLLVVPSPMEFLTSSVLVFISDGQGSLTTAVHLRISSPSENVDRWWKTDILMSVLSTMLPSVPNLERLEFSLIYSLVHQSEYFILDINFHLR